MKNPILDSFDAWGIKYIPVDFDHIVVAESDLADTLEILDHASFTWAKLITSENLPCHLHLVRISGVES